MEREWTRDDCLNMIQDTTELLGIEKIKQFRSMSIVLKNSSEYVNDVAFWQWLGRNYKNTLGSSELIREAAISKSTWLKKQLQGKGYEWDYRQAMRSDITKIASCFDCGDDPTQRGIDMIETNIVNGKIRLTYQNKAYFSKNKPDLHNTPKDTIVVTNLEKKQTTEQLGYKTIAFKDANDIQSDVSKRYEQALDGKVETVYGVKNATKAIAKAGIISSLFAMTDETMASYEQWKNDEITTSEYVKKIFSVGCSECVSTSLTAAAMIPVEAVLTTAGLSSLFTIPVFIVFNKAIGKIVKPCFGQGEYKEIMCKAKYYQSITEIDISFANAGLRYTSHYNNYIDQICVQRRQFEEMRNHNMDGNNNQLYPSQSYAAVLPNKPISQKDIEYYGKLSPYNMRKIIMSMMLLANNNLYKIESIENQTWFQRMCYSISGKNKMTMEEIQRNRDKINIYLAQIITIMREQNKIDHDLLLQIGDSVNYVLSELNKTNSAVSLLTNQINEMRAELNAIHIEMDFRKRWNLLCESFHLDKYNNKPQLISICQILYQMKYDIIADDEYRKCIEEHMYKAKILNDSSNDTTVWMYSLFKISDNDVVLFASDLGKLPKSNIAAAITDFISNYFLATNRVRSDVDKNRARFINAIIKRHNLENKYSTREIYDELAANKLDMVRNLVPVETIQENAKLKEATDAFLCCDLDRAFDLFTELAEAGNARAMYFLGYYYNIGLGKAARNLNKSNGWFNKSVQAGDSLSKLCMLWRKPKSQINDSDKKLFEDSKKIAENGDFLVQFEIGMILFKTGSNEALYWLELSANSGYWFAMHILARRYNFLNNKTEAFKWCKRSVESGYIKNAFDLASKYFDGEGTEQNYTEAMKWFKEAYNLKDENSGGAANNIGVIFNDGLGIDVDKKSAFKWYKIGAELDNEVAMYNLGDLYRLNGNSSKAKEWWTKSAELECDVAKQDLLKIYGIRI